MEDNKMMSEQTKYEFEKTVSGYGSQEQHDFVIPRELTVTITLNEYRQLLQRDAKAKADEEMRKGWKKDEEIRDLKEKVENLKAVIVGMRENCVNAEPVMADMRGESDG